MNDLCSGKAYDLRGSFEALRAIWERVKAADPKAVFIGAESDRIAVIGTDKQSIMTLGLLLANDKISVTRN